MKVNQGPKSKVRNQEVPPVKGAATRSYETSPAGGEPRNVVGKRVKIKSQKIPNKF